MMRLQTQRTQCTSLLLGLALVFLGGCLRKTDSAAPVSSGDGSIIGGKVEDSKGFRIDGCILNEGDGLTADNFGGDGKLPTGSKCRPGNLYTHKTTTHQPEFSTDACALTDRTKLRTSDALLNCFIEADEQELHFHGASMAFNVPTDYCEYSSFTPYYFWNYQPGDEWHTNGATQVKIILDLEGKILPQATNPVVALQDGFEATTTSGVAAVTSPTDDAVPNTDYTGARCAYDYSQQDPPGPNCCQGGYTQYACRAVDINSDGVADAPSGSFWTGDFDFCPSNYKTEITNEKWGGNPGSCLSGPAVLTGKDKSPTFFIFEVSGTGMNGIYRTYGNQKLRTAGNFFHANHYAYYTAGVPNNALSLDPDAAETNHPSVLKTWALIKPYPVYELACWDRGWELLARIRVFIREWNTKTSLEDFKEEIAGSADSDSPDEEGLETGTNFPYKNDYADLRDLEFTSTEVPDAVQFPSLRSLVGGVQASSSTSFASFKVSDDSEKHSECTLDDHHKDQKWPTP